MSTSDRPSDEALWRCVVDTLQATILPALRPGFEQDSARQLTGVGRYALLRAADRGPDRAAELAPLLGLPPSSELREVLAEASRALVAATAPVTVRQLLLRYLAEDVAEAAPLLETFSGHAPVDLEPDAVDVPEGPALRDWLASAFE